jgi:hypothetical protein
MIAPQRRLKSINPLLSRAVRPILKSAAVRANPRPVSTAAQVEGILQAAW